MRKDVFMNSRTSRVALVVMLLSAFVFLAPAVFGADKEIEQAQRLTTFAQKGPAALLEYIRETGESTPLIYSQWYVDRLTVKNPKKAETQQA